MFGSSVVRWLSCLLLVFSAPLLARGVEDSPLLWNTPADQVRCVDSASALWVEFASGQACIRYFSASPLQGAPVVIVMFHGDRTIEMHRAPQAIAGNTLRAKDQQAAALSRRAGVPVVIVARPGTYGSSGNHGQRRQASEFQALDAALDQLRQRHTIGRFVLLGHSGGATVMAALMTLGRKDVKCAVMTSGAFALLERAQMIRRSKGLPARDGRDTNGLLHPYDPLQHIDGIARVPGRPLILIGNRKDQVSPFVLQERFYQALRDAGLEARLIEAPAFGPAFHQLRDDIGLKTAAQCAQP
ncbi:alpha/beta fold hydrolase [Pseudomonas sp. S 311-6]|uniref:alpha/beta hydrolase family protein n=1 Tax=Pseudomonas TaxID=286 RepID=UPI0020979AD8|nr:MULTISPECIES: alpha/beta fold hydrolase [Pseudomonas]MCO7567413.1 alpha/beta fold hydrolase [Pseudomonas mosselii]MCO7618807.1 alpha/beta fold hydrolase [Pseudomonas guariconensis]MCO7642613.1 alpha/beta fold hydrolase [Pseudomonas sp. S 311-6]